MSNNNFSPLSDVKEFEAKNVVKEKYGQIAKESGSCCSSSCSSSEVSASGQMNLDYSQIDGYVAEADLKLGCGIPLAPADIQKGQTVLDLGSGAGNDAFIVSKIVGETGKVIGLDFTEEMIEKANKNKSNLGYTNIDFLFGDIEEMPIENEKVDRVISNCVINLVPDKDKAFGEIARVLKKGGKFSISDVVSKGEVPDAIRKSAEFYTGCIAGALDQDKYLEIIESKGFSDIKIESARKLDVPGDSHDGFALYSINVTAVK